MKTLSGHIRVVVAALSLAAALTRAHAEKMNAEIHTVVIEKLEQALARSAKDDSNVSLKPVRSRLADLYAERARLRAMNEAEEGCNNCRGSGDDRNRALKLYDTVLAEADKSKRGTLLLQMAQLHELNGDFKTTQTLHEKILSEGSGKHSKDILAEAYLGRAEARFNKGLMDQAQKDFESALKLVSNGRKGPIHHRIAWCQLNKGEQVQAVQTMIHILETPELLTREASEGPTFNESFQEDVARDLATIFARGPVSHREISLLESLTPDRARKETLKHFANECERLGQRVAAIDAWTAVVKYEERNADRLEAMVRVTQIRFDLGQKPEALKGLRDVAHLWKAQGCDDVDICTGLRTRLRALVVAWNKNEKKEPSALLSDAYLAYLAVVPDDMEMTQWAATVARVQKRYATAAQLYYQSAVLASQAPRKNAGTQQVLENGLVGEVEMAELSKDKRTREISYDHYLALNPNGAIAPKIRYQRAHVAYERGDMMEASTRFHDFAVSNHCRVKPAPEVSDLCIKAADLDLDALVGMKAHASVQLRGSEYARTFPKRMVEYTRISRTAVLKQAEGQEPHAALAKLSEADLRGATTEERVRFLKTWLSLAEKQRDLAAVRAAAKELINTKGLAADDREFALGKTAWASEMALDFNEAYLVSKQMQLKNMSPDERAMKLALLAELSGRDPSVHEEEFQRVSKDSARKALVRAKMIRNAKNPAAEIAKHDRTLRPYPAVYAPLALEIYGRTLDIKIADRALQAPGVLREPAGRVLAREAAINQFTKIEAPLAQHQLNSHSDGLIQRTIADRLYLLARAEKAGNQAIASKDWVLQVLALTALARENERVYNDIVHLPVPSRLSGAKKEAYVKAVEGKARGYKAKAEQIQRKVNMLWADTQTQATIERDHRGASPAVRRVLAGELRRLRDAAPGGINRQIDEELKTPSQQPSEQQVAALRSQAKQNPFSREILAKLRDLEVTRGRETMVAYLDARLLKLKEQGARP